MKKHTKTTVCNACVRGDCDECIDLARLFAGLTDPICTCTRRQHSNEPHGAPEHRCDPACAAVNGG